MNTNAMNPRRLPARSQFACFKVATGTTSITSPASTGKANSVESGKILILSPLVPSRVKDGKFKIVTSPKASVGPLKAFDLGILNSLPCEKVKEN